MVKCKFLSNPIKFETALQKRQITFPRIDIKRYTEEGGDLHAIFPQFHWRRHIPTKIKTTSHYSAIFPTHRIVL